jgi:hypothetical protein
MRVRLRTEFTLAASNRAGSLAKLLDTLARGGANVLAVCAYGQGEQANLMIVAEPEEKARAALQGAGLRAVETQVLCVTTASGKGAGARIASKLAKAGMNIDYAYATTSGSGQGMAVFGVADPHGALRALRKR